MSEVTYNKRIPADACYIIETLEAKGYEAYIVGGCVRDMLMGREPNDWDITTSAKPEEVKQVFKRTYDTGIEHGTVTVIVDTEHYEVTTYRIEGEYKDCRHPEAVSFVEDITLDLSRRDFTMNAIAYHPVRGFVDPYNGRQAIANNCIESVRDAKERFTEDALRILRGVRFAAQLGFEIDANTIEGIKVCRSLLEHISKERVRDEFLKICMSDRPEYVDVLYQLELLPYILPEMIPMYELAQPKTDYHPFAAGHTLLGMQYSPKDLVIRLTVLLHDIAKPVMCHIPDFKGYEVKGEAMTKHILKMLRMDNQTIHDVSKLVRYQVLPQLSELSKYSVKQYLNVLGEPLFDKLCQVILADGRATSEVYVEEVTEVVRIMQELKEEVIVKGECYNLKMLAINGQDLMAVGVPRGQLIGQLLGEALDYVMHHPEMNTKEAILHYIETKDKE